jgi:hypothetical protein
VCIPVDIAQGSLFPFVMLHEVDVYVNTSCIGNNNAMGSQPICFYIQL